MKIAGRKNDGAWYRMNKVISELNVGDKDDLLAGLVESVGAKADAAWTDVTALAAECGVALPLGVTDGASWLSAMVANGIPRQVWNGRLSFTTYSLVEDKYVANYQSQIHFFAKDLRRFCKYWLHGRRAINDLTNATGEGVMNPGKLPNANPES